MLFHKNGSKIEQDVVIRVLSIAIVINIWSFLSVKISLKSNDLFAKFLTFGLAIGIIIQASLNLSVVIGLIPVTGVTLPFFSYGGSSLLVTMASIGIILSISKK